MTVTLVRGDAAHLPLPDSSVDLIVTSPPYFALRSYQDTPQLCARCIELIGKDWLHPNPEHLRNLREAWPDWDAHVAAEHVARHYPGQIGSEATPAEFIDELVACTREWVRVLKPCGSLWVNLGDKYVADNRGSGVDDKRGAAKWAPAGPAGYPTGGMRQKSLMGLPWRYALRCIDDLGLILRAEVIWSKPNGLPESVTDRVRRSHEQWFHFVVRPRYYAAVDTIRDGYSENPRAVWNRANGFAQNTRHPSDVHSSTLRGREETGRRGAYENPLGKLPGSVWSIPSQPLTVPKFEGHEPGQPITYLWTDDDAQDWLSRWPGRSLRSLPDHFAAFPQEWPRRIIQGWSPSGICTACGEGRRPVTEGTPMQVRASARRISAMLAAGPGAASARTLPSGTMLTPPRNFITGECCACTPYTDHPERRGKDWNTNRNGYKITASGRNQHDDMAERAAAGPVREYDVANWTPPPTRPAVVLDPFGGTGTVALMADVLGRHGISVDMSADYCRLAAWRTSDPGERARAMQVDKPEPVADGQMQLFA